MQKYEERGIEGDGGQGLKTITAMMELKIQSKSAEQMIKEYCAKEGNRRLLDYIIHTHRPLEGIMNNACAYLTHYLPSAVNQAEPLYHLCLNTAVSEWQLGQEITSDPGKHAACFIKGLIIPMAHIKRITVTTPGVQEQDTSAWDPLTETLSGWVLRHNAVPVVHNRESSAYWSRMYMLEFKAFIISRFILTRKEEMRMVAPHMDFILGR